MKKYGKTKTRNKIKHKQTKTQDKWEEKCFKQFLKWICFLVCDVMAMDRFDGYRIYSYNPPMSWWSRIITLAKITGLSLVELHYTNCKETSWSYQLPDTVLQTWLKCTVLFFKIEFSVSFEKSSLQGCKFKISVETVKPFGCTK